MRRDPALIPLSHQHHNGLALSVLMERALEGSPSLETVQHVARQAVDRYELELRNHFDLEEKLLFPACASAGCNPALIAELITEHRQLEGLVAQLAAKPGEETARAFLNLLREHIRKEERVLFEEAQALIPGAELSELGNKLSAGAVQICLKPF